MRCGARVPKVTVRAKPRAAIRSCSTFHESLTLGLRKIVCVRVDEFEFRMTFFRAADHFLRIINAHAARGLYCG